MNIRPSLQLAALAAGAAISLCGGRLALAQNLPDVLTPLGRTVVAVLDLGQNPHLLLIEDEGESVGYRLLGIGDEYRAGWIITVVSAEDVTLQKAARVRTVQIEGQTPAPSPAPAGPQRRSPPAAKLSLTNSLVGGSPPGMFPPLSPEPFPVASAPADDLSTDY